MVVDIIRIEEGLVKYRNTFPGGPVAFFADDTQETYVIKSAVIVMQTLLGDGVVVGANFTCELETLMAYRNPLSDKRFIDVTSFGNLSGSSSYHA
jgi:hypothetical protein